MPVSLNLIHAPRWQQARPEAAGLGFRAPRTSRSPHSREISAHASCNPFVGSRHDYWRRPELPARLRAGYYVKGRPTPLFEPVPSHSQGRRPRGTRFSRRGAQKSLGNKGINNPDRSEHYRSRPLWRRSESEGEADLALTQAQFNALVDDHGPAVYRVAYRLVGDTHEAEDMVQETFRSAWRSRHNFQPGRGDRAWLMSILRRRTVDRWRRRKLPTVQAGDSALDLAVETENPAEQGYSDEMQHALAQLPDQLRETLLLVVVGELTHQEAADLLAVPLGTVLSRVSRARSRLRDLLVAAAGTS